MDRAVDRVPEKIAAPGVRSGLQRKVSRQRVANECASFIRRSRVEPPALRGAVLREHDMPYLTMRRALINGAAGMGVTLYGAGFSIVSVIVRDARSSQWMFSLTRTAHPP